MLQSKIQFLQALPHWCNQTFSANICISTQPKYAQCKQRPEEICLNLNCHILSTKLFYPKIRRGTTLDPSLSNFNCCCFLYKLYGDTYHVNDHCKIENGLCFPPLIVCYPKHTHSTLFIYLASSFGAQSHQIDRTLRIIICYTSSFNHKTSFDKTPCYTTTSGTYKYI